MNLRSRLGQRIGIGFVVLSIAFVGWYLFRPGPLKGAAAGLVNAMRDGDGDALFAATSVQERECSNLDPQKLRKAWEILLQPYIADSRLVRIEPPKQTTNEVQATASAWYEDRHGNPWRLVVIANQAEGGPKAIVLAHMCFTASLFNDQGVAQARITNELMLAGLRRYRSKLESIGIHRMMLNPATCVTWDELEAKLTAAMKNQSPSDGGA